MGWFCRRKLANSAQGNRPVTQALRAEAAGAGGTDDLPPEQAATLANITAEITAQVEVGAAQLLADVDRQHPTTPPQEHSEPTTATRHSFAADEQARQLGYQNAAHQAASERGKAARAARTPADKIARARQVGMVARDEYLTPEEEAAALRPGPDGLPDARLERVRHRLLVVTPVGWVNPNSRSAHKVGLHAFQLRGAGYYEAALKAGKFTPGSPLKLVREPDNKHDPNAIAIYAEGARNKSGYVPAARAKTLARLLDGGTDLVAMSVRGSGHGTDGTVPHILICDRKLFDHLNR